MKIVRDGNKSTASSGPNSSIRMVFVWKARHVIALEPRPCHTPERNRWWCELCKKMSAGIIFFGMTNGARTVVYKNCAIQKVHKMNVYWFAFFVKRKKLCLLKFYSITFW